MKAVANRAAYAYDFGQCRTIHHHTMGKRAASERLAANLNSLLKILIKPTMRMRINRMPTQKQFDQRPKLTKEPPPILSEFTTNF